MAVSYVGASNAAGQALGSASASTVSITPTLPTGAASGDRILVVQAASNTSGTTPTNWTVVGTKDTTVGSGAVASGSGARRLTVYYRDYDGVWTMPAFTLTSATNNSHWIGAVAVRRTDSSRSWNIPTITTVGASFNTATTSYTDTTAASFTTHSNGLLVIGTAYNDNVTSSAAALTQTGATFGTVTERCDGGTATGNIVAGTVHTATVTTGAAATLTHTQTISAASQGESLIVEQTEITGASVAVVQTASSTALPLVFANAVTAGNTVVVALVVYGNAIPVFAGPTLGGSAVVGAYPVFNDSGSNCIWDGANTQTPSLWVLPGCAAASSIDFTTKAIAVNGGVIAWEVSGLGSPIINKSARATGTSTALSSGASGTTTAAPTFIAGLGLNDSAVATTPAGFTTINPTGNGWAGYQIATASGSSYTWSQTITSSLWGAGVAALVSTRPGRQINPVPVFRSNLY